MRMRIVACGCEPPPRLCERLERQLQFGLGRFGGYIGDMRLRIDKSEAGSEHRCRLVVSVRALGTVEADALDSDCERAALRAVDRAVRRIQYELPARTEGVIPGVVG